MNWLVASLIAMVCWGVWGLLMKMASNYFHWSEIFIITNIVTLVATLLVFVWLKPLISIHSQGFGFALLAGIIGLVALIAFYSAIGGGKAIIVVPLTALYPIVTTILSYLVLREEISLMKGLGIGLALIAILLVSLD